MTSKHRKEKTETNRNKTQITPSKSRAVDESDQILKAFMGNDHVNKSFSEREGEQEGREQTGV